MLRVWLPTIVGVAVIVLTMRDVVHELFHPDSAGSLSRSVTRGVWRLTRAAARGRRSAVLRAGPMLLIAVALVWTTLLLVGWALIFWPRLTGDFNPDPAVPPALARGFGSAIYVSMASMTTLSASDLMPRSAGMRWAVTLEAYVGLVLFTAWITWVLGIYPVLAERRAFAHEVALLRRSHGSPAAAATESPPEAAADMLRSLTEQVLRVTAQLRQSRVTYYFQNDAEALALAVQLPWVLALARAARDRADAPAVRHRGALLDAAVKDLTDLLGDQYLDLHDGPPPEVVLRALAKDHLLERPVDEAMRAASLR